MRNTRQLRCFYSSLSRVNANDLRVTPVQLETSLQLPLAPRKNNKNHRLIQMCRERASTIPRYNIPDNTQTADKKEPVGSAWRETRASAWRLTWGQSVSAQTWGQGRSPGAREGRGCIFRINLFIEDTAASLVFRPNLCCHLHLCGFYGSPLSSQTQTALNAGQ